MRRLILLASLFPVSLLAAPFAGGDAVLGKKLFDDNQCNQCHLQMVGGDGSAIFTRPNRKVKNEAQMLKQINFCAANRGITLNAEQTHHLGAYLNQRYYHLK